MEKFTVEVTEKHIKKGVRTESTSCPIALAAKSLRLKDVLVGSDEITFIKGKKQYAAQLSKTASKFVTKFDEGKKVKPFSFTVKPTEVKEEEDEFNPVANIDTSSDDDEFEDDDEESTSSDC